MKNRHFTPPMLSIELLEMVDLELYILLFENQIANRWAIEFIVN